ncbi:MAG TPA: PilT/PilU family type 4a pilus ATPase, partial [Tepidisphaeraceae bacterium]|nr:PilT/PilU family type 4a pilus ATPase [Tepidisphaeraceae bacterium]
MDLHQLLRFAVEHKASDVHIQAGLPPRVRIGGIIRAVNLPAVSDEQVRQFIAQIIPPRFHDNLDERLFKGIDFSYAAPELSRFRCSAYRHLGSAGIVMRIVQSRIPTIAELNLPPVVSQIALSRRGMTLVTGTTGSGKTTTLAAMVELINQTWPAKIICIEDPVEYLHVPKQAIITQLEVGSDTPSFEQALRQALRQDPDVILVGELRDVETLKVALRAADTGHQILTTVHSASAPQTVERIIAMFPPAEHKLLLTQLAGNLE